MTVSGIVFVVLWIVTFIPAWWLLLRLLALSTAPKKQGQFWAILLLQRIVIALPYVVLLIVGQNVINDVIKIIIIGFVALGAIFSIIRFVYKEHLIGFLWKIYGYFYDGLLHYAPYRRLVSSVVALAKKEQPSAGMIIELGCGTGNVIKALQQEYPDASIIGVDSSPTMIKSARKKTKLAQIYQADLMEFLRSRPTGMCDLIVMQNVLYAVKERVELWGEANRVLKGNGVMVITNSDKTGSFSITKEHLNYGKWYELLYPRLIIVGVIDAYISQLSKTGSFDFVEETMLKTEVEKLFDFSPAKRVYGGVNILFSLRKKNAHAK